MMPVMVLCLTGSLLSSDAFFGAAEFHLRRFRAFTLRAGRSLRGRSEKLHASETSTRNQTVGTGSHPTRFACH
eukprot:3941335-Rhodomonas_salina.1